MPWLSIATSMPVWAIVVSNLCGDMGFYVFETSMPSYLSEVLKFDVKTVSRRDKVKVKCIKQNSLRHKVKGQVY